MNELTICTYRGFRITDKPHNDSTKFSLYTRTGTQVTHQDEDTIEEMVDTIDIIIGEVMPDHYAGEFPKPKTSKELIAINAWLAYTKEERKHIDRDELFERLEEMFINFVEAKNAMIESEIKEQIFDFLSDTREVSLDDDYDGPREVESGPAYDSILKTH